jgi:hypothetical protein
MRRVGYGRVQRHDLGSVRLAVRTPPPEGDAYTAPHDLVRLPANVVPPPKGLTSNERWHLGSIPKEVKDAETESVWTTAIA